jgi:hypothetical protein
MKSYSTVTDAANFDMINSIFREWMSDTGAKNLGVFFRKGRIDVELPEFEPKDKDGNYRWDGTLLVHFKDTFTPAEVINYIVASSRADEVSMEDDKTLRLWWD